MPRILAVDPGARRVGLALSDPLGIIASPLTVIEGSDEERLVAEIRRVAEANEVSLVLVGFPVRDDGYEGDGCRRSRRLYAKLLRAGLRAELWDESSTTEQAYEVTRRHGMDRRGSRRAKDAVAASFILSSYLEARAAERGRDV